MNRKRFSLFLVMILFVSVTPTLAWTGPTQVPPNSNVSSPANVGTKDQVKNAGLGISSLAVFGNAILSGVSNYLNFGSTSGSSGYGLRDNGGTMQIKNSGGSWTDIGTASGQTPWLVSGSNIYYSGGNVGIGTASSGAMLQVQGDIHSSTGVFSDTEANDYIQIDPKS